MGCVLGDSKVAGRNVLLGTHSEGAARHRYDNVRTWQGWSKGVTYSAHHASGGLQRARGLVRASSLWRDMIWGGYDVNQLFCRERLRAELPHLRSTHRAKNS